MDCVTVNIQGNTPSEPVQPQPGDSDAPDSDNTFLPGKFEMNDKVILMGLGLAGLAFLMAKAR